MQGGLFKVASVCFVAAASVSCANLETIDRTKPLPNFGEAIHLDAPQRLVIFDQYGRACAEPTPDALQSYASSLGLGVSVPSEGAGSLAQALQTSSASIGLHTQSITLMRDALYRICEASHNGDLSKGDVIQLLERSQDLTLGVLAIEQLTGAVVARQVILAGSANASASANVANTQAQLDNAKKVEASKKAALQSAQDEQTKQQAAVDATQQAIAAEKGKPAPDQPTIDKLTSQLKTQQDQLDKDKAAVASAQDDYTNAQKATQAIEENFNAAITSATATATGTGQFSTGADRNNVDKDTAAQIADATKYVVGTIVLKGHLTDTCINLMAEYATADVQTRSALSQANAVCGKVIETYLAVYDKWAASQGSSKPDGGSAKPGGPPPPPPGPPAPLMTPAPPDLYR